MKDYCVAFSSIKSSITCSAARRALWLSAFALILLTSTSFAEDKYPLTRSSVNKPAFSHGYHIEEVGLKCSECHGSVEASKTGGDNMLPDFQNTCSSCHEAKDLAGKGIHLALPVEGFLQSNMSDFAPLFSHERHVTKAGLKCEECHTALDAAVEFGHKGHFPHMPECIACHEQKVVSTECATCHGKGEIPRPANHNVMWIQQHGIAAEMASSNCTMCHQSGSERDCQSCHNGDAIISPHPHEYLSTHGHDAHLSDMRCGVCHEQRSFCNECHRDMGILPADHFRPGFVTSEGGTHGENAEFDLESCMSCHDVPNQEPVCARCHDAK